MSEQLKKETGLSQPAGSEGPKKSAAKKSFFRSRSGEKKKSAAKSAEPTGQKKSAAKKAPAKSKTNRNSSKAVIEKAADAGGLYDLDTVGEQLLVIYHAIMTSLLSFSEGLYSTP